MSAVPGIAGSSALGLVGAGLVGGGFLGRFGCLVGGGFVGRRDVGCVGGGGVGGGFVRGRGRLTGLPPGLPAPPPRIEDQPANCGDEGDGAHPDVPAHAEQLRRGVDPQRLDPGSSHGVARDVEREQATGAAIGVVPFPQHQPTRQRQVPQSLVEERRMERGHVQVARWPVRGVDLQPPGQVGGPTEQFLVEPVAQPPDRLGDRQRGGDDVEQLGHGQAATMRDKAPVPTPAISPPGMPRPPSHTANTWSQRPSNRSRSVSTW